MEVKERPKPDAQDAEIYQLLSEESEHAQSIAAIRRGLEQVERGDAIGIDEAETQLRKKHGFSR